MTATTDQTGAQFWDRHYASFTTTGPPPPPTAPLTGVLAELDLLATPGRALELACGRGADALWLAGLGWSVTAVDVSERALDGVRREAERAGLTDRVITARHDLAQTTPDGGPWDLLYACFFHPTTGEDRDAGVRRCAAEVAPGGHLVLVDHASSAPWSWEQRDDFPTPEAVWDRLDLPDDWTPRVRERRTRVATGPGGEVAEVADTVLVGQRGRRGQRR